MASAQWAWAEGLILKIVNVLAYLCLSWFNIFYIVSPRSVLGRTKQTYFTPSTSVFFIWYIINFLFLGTVIYQFTSRAKAVVIDTISWRFPLLVALNTTLVVFWANEEYSIAFYCSLLSAAGLWLIYLNVKEIVYPKSWRDDLFVHLPFSTWHAWSNVVVLLIAFQAFGVDATEQPAGTYTEFSVFIAL